MVTLERAYRATMAGTPHPTPLREWRCRVCHRLLMLVSLTAGSVVECRCRHCKTDNVMAIADAPAAN